MLDMSRVGDALLRVTGAIRINYAMFGNAEPALHAHVVPRYADEPENLRTQHPWSYDWNAAPAFDLGTHGELAETLGRELTRMGVSKPMRYAPGTRKDV
jgi:diadenosine tetraphosphate (Ap4A) HIT family hydrolase